MKVLITGHEGFIGTHLSRELHNHGYTIVGHDRQAGDLSYPGVFIESVERHKPNYVVHLAAQVGRLFGERDVAHTINANATMTTLVAHACGNRKIPVLYSSTSEVYGDQGPNTCFEYSPLMPPHNLYGETKLWGERALRLYTDVEQRKIVRLSMPAGPGAPPGHGRRALDTFLWQAHHRQPITVHRGAERSWCDVRDTVRGIRLVLEHGTHETYNIGRDDRPVSMLDLAKRCCDIAGAPHTLIEEVDPPAMQTVVKRLSTVRLRGLGWEPEFELDDTIADIYEWVQRFDATGRLAA